MKKIMKLDHYIIIIHIREGGIACENLAMVRNLSPQLIQGPILCLGFSRSLKHSSEHQSCHFD